jgi:hypothetical protein
MDNLKRDKYKVMVSFLVELIIRGKHPTGFVDTAILARARRWNLIAHKGVEITKYGHEFLQKYKDLK